MSIAQLEAREVELEAPSGLWREAWQRLRRNPGALVGFALVGLFVILAVLAPLIAPFDPRAQDLSLLRGGCCPGPSGEHWFGVDDLGRDEFSRIVYGARFSLLIGVVSVAVGLSVGLVLGAIAGYVGGVVDSIVMRLMDIMLSIPGLLLSGAVLTETVFAWPGLGTWLVNAIRARDFPVLQGGILFVSVVFVLVNLFVDVMYAIINPRIRYS